MVACYGMIFIIMFVCGFMCMRENVMAISSMVVNWTILFVLYSLIQNGEPMTFEKV